MATETKKPPESAYQAFRAAQKRLAEVAHDHGLATAELVLADLEYRYAGTPESELEAIGTAARLRDAEARVQALHEASP